MTTPTDIGGSMTQSCKTCRFAEWERSKAGRRQFQYAGTCLFQVPETPLPDCITNSYGYRQHSRMKIWGDMGQNCPCYEKEQA